MLPKEWLEEFDAKCANVEKSYDELFAYAATLPTNPDITEGDKNTILRLVTQKMTSLHSRVLM